MRFHFVRLRTIPRICETKRSTILDLLKGVMQPSAFRRLSIASQLKALNRQCRRPVAPYDPSFLRIYAEPAKPAPGKRIK